MAKYMFCYYTLNPHVITDAIMCKQCFIFSTLTNETVENDGFVMYHKLPIVGSKAKTQMCCQYNYYQNEVLETVTLFLLTRYDRSTYSTSYKRKHKETLILQTIKLSNIEEPRQV